MTVVALGSASPPSYRVSSKRTGSRSAWKVALLSVPIAFCVWTAYLIVSVAGIRRRVEMQVGVATQLSSLDRKLRSGALDAIDARPLSPGPRSWERARAGVDTAERALFADPESYQIIAPEALELRSTVQLLDSLDDSLRKAPLPDSVRDILTTRVRAATAHGSDIIAIATHKLRVRLSLLSLRLGRRWTSLSIVASISILLAIVTTLLLIAYGRSLEKGARLLAELRVSLSEVKHLRGILPICAYCKRIRDDSDYWHQVETYVSRHSDASFTHGICPECLAQHVEPHLADTSHRG